MSILGDAKQRLINSGILPPEPGFTKDSSGGITSRLSPDDPYGHYNRLRGDPSLRRIPGLGGKPPVKPISNGIVKRCPGGYKLSSDGSMCVPVEDYFESPITPSTKPKTGFNLATSNLSPEEKERLADTTVNHVFTPSMLENPVNAAAAQELKRAVLAGDRPSYYLVEQAEPEVANIIESISGFLNGNIDSSSLLSSLPNPTSFISNLFSGLDFNNISSGLGNVLSDIGSAATNIISDLPDGVRNVINTVRENYEEAGVPYDYSRTGEDWANSGLTDEYGNPYGSIPVDDPGGRRYGNKDVDSDGDVDIHDVRHLKAQDDHITDSGVNISNVSANPATGLVNKEDFVQAAIDQGKLHLIDQNFYAAEIANAIRDGYPSINGKPDPNAANKVSNKPVLPGDIWADVGVGIERNTLTGKYRYNGVEYNTISEVSDARDKHLQQGDYTPKVVTPTIPTNSQTTVTTPETRVETQTFEDQAAIEQRQRDLRQEEREQNRAAREADADTSWRDAIDTGQRVSGYSADLNQGGYVNRMWEGGKVTSTEAANMFADAIKRNAPQEELDEIAYLACGGEVYKNQGGFPGQPKGTDQVPTWLTEGEYVIDRDSTQAQLPSSVRSRLGKAKTGMEAASILNNYEPSGGVEGALKELDDMINRMSGV